jgi:hypothetical protein
MYFGLMVCFGSGKWHALTTGFGFGVIIRAAAALASLSSFWLSIMILVFKLCGILRLGIHIQVWPVTQL